MKVIICPGIHDSKLTESFLDSVRGDWETGRLGREGEENKLDLQWLVLPTEEYAPYSPFAVYHWFIEREQSQVWQIDSSLKSNSDELFFITFSAGVVGGIGSAIALQNKGFKIKAFIAIDGWGVPLWGNFPIYRFSHDYFTHWSSALLGTGKESFYADPPVEHLRMWRSPEICYGWIISDSAPKIRCSAKDYLQKISDV